MFDSRNLWLGLVVAVSFICSFNAQARVFNIANEHLATYFGGTYGLSNLQDHAYGASSGVGVVTDHKVATNYAGELGFILALKELQLRLGGEYLFSSPASEVKGRAGGVSYFNLSSKVTALVPKASFERAIQVWPQSRLSLGGGMGWAFVSLDQAYRFTPDGEAALGVTDYTEKASGGALMWNLYLLGEMHLSDTTTVAIEAGYKDLKVQSLKSEKSVTAISGAYSDGAELRNNDGSRRSFDFGGSYISLSFRFYL